MTVKKELPDKDLFTEVFSNNNAIEAGKYFGVSRNVITKWAKSFGFQKRPVFAPNKDEFATFYKHHSIGDTAKHFSVSLGTISKWIVAFGLQKYKPHNRKNKPTCEQLKEFLLSHTNKEAATYFGLGINTIDRLIKIYDLTDMDKELVIEPTNKLPMPDKNHFEAIYMSKSIEEVATHFGVDYWIINRWRDRFDIKCKTDRELPNAFTDKQLELITGSLLGDGCLRKVNTVDANSYFTEQHGPDQYNYLQYKFKELMPFSNSLKPKSNYKVVYLGKKQYKIDYNQIRTSFVYDTYTSPLFTELEMKWYKRNGDGEYEYIKRADTLCRIKQLPEDIVLTPFSVAMWYYDDGTSKWRNDPRHYRGTTRRSRNINICTQSFQKMSASDSLLS